MCAVLCCSHSSDPIALIEVNLLQIYFIIPCALHCCVVEPPNRAQLHNRFYAKVELAKVLAVHKVSCHPERIFQWTWLARGKVLQLCLEAQRFLPPTKVPRKPMHKCHQLPVYLVICIDGTGNHGRSRSVLVQTPDDVTRRADVMFTCRRGLNDVCHVHEMGRARQVSSGDSLILRYCFHGRHTLGSSPAGRAIQSQVSGIQPCVGNSVPPGVTAKQQAHFVGPKRTQYMALSRSSISIWQLILM